MITVFLNCIWPHLIDPVEVMGDVDVDCAGLVPAHLEAGRHQPHQVVSTAHDVPDRGEGV